MVDNMLEQGPSHDDMVISATPDPATPMPTTPGSHQVNALPRTPHLPSSNPFPARTPRTPRGPAVSTCTDDKDLYASVTVHTAKCTECDKRNKKTMLRCPNCTFQLCSPCYEKRVKQGKGLRHGNMATPRATEGAATPATVNRTVRKKPSPSTSAPTGEATKKDVDETKDGEDVDDHKAPPAGKSTTKKTHVHKKRRSEDSTADESSEDNFEPDGAHPRPSKRSRIELTFAESALATAGRTPPTTRASRRAAAQEATPMAGPSNLVEPGASVVDGTSRILELMRQHGVDHYDEHLLGRREPFIPNSVAEIPAIIKRGGKPRPSADDIYVNIQSKLREKMPELQNDKDPEAADDDPLSYMIVKKGDVERQEYLCTVRGFVETVATTHHGKIAMDDDDKRAMVKAMEFAAQVWGKNLFNKLDPATQQKVRPGLMLRLDRVDYKYSIELGELMNVHADRAMQELGIGRDAPASLPSNPLT